MLACFFERTYVCAERLFMSKKSGVSRGEHASAVLRMARLNYNGKIRRK